RERDPLMEDLVVGGIDGVFDRLDRVAVELRLEMDAMDSVLPHPDVVWRDLGCWPRAHIRPAQAEEPPDGGGTGLYRQIELAVGRLRWRFQAVALRVVQPTVVGTRDAAFFDASVQ